MAWVILLRIGWTIALSWRQDQRAHISSSTTMRTQLHQDQVSEASSPLLKARGDEQGSVTTAQQEDTEKNGIPSSAALLSPTYPSSGSIPSSNKHHSSPAQRSREEVGSELKVGAGIHLVQGQQWKEDALFTSQGSLDGPAPTMSYGLFVVADGMGGHRLTGHEACELAIGTVTSRILASLSETETASWDEQKLMDVVIEGMKATNQALFTCNQEHHAYMEVSLVVCLVVGEVAFGASIGETRVYLYRESAGLLKLTRDNVGGTAAQCLGERTEVNVDSFIMILQQGDRLLLCTDGLWKFVHASDREGIMSSSVLDQSQMCSALIQTALEGGEDHIGVVVAQFNGGPSFRVLPQISC
jgi:serine/threonine protein phosphatase PrpC